jgi:hypothetical protein
MRICVNVSIFLLLLLVGSRAQAFCSVSWAYFDARSNGPALVRCTGVGETFTLWQQFDGNGQRVWAHSTPAVSLDGSRLLSTFEWDSLNPLTFTSEHISADKYIYVNLLDSNQTLSIGTNEFPADRFAGDGMNIGVGGNAAAGTTAVLAWSKSSNAATSYRVGGLRSTGSTRLFAVNGGNDVITNGAALHDPFINGKPFDCPTCRDFDGSLTVIAGSSGDEFFVEGRVGATNLYGNDGDDTFGILESDHLGSLMVDAGGGGANAAYIGKFNSLNSIQGPISFDGNNCTDALYVTVQSSADAASRQVSLVGQPGSGLISGLAPADISFHCDSALGSYPTYLELHAGTKSDIFTIDGLFSPETHINGTDGDDSVQFSVRHDGSIAGALYVSNSAGSVGVTIDDQAGTIPSDVELRKDYAYFKTHGVNDRLAWVIWNTPGATDVANVTLKLGSAANNVTVYGVPDNVGYFVYGGDGGMHADLAGDKLGFDSTIALVGGQGRDIFTMTPAAPGSSIVNIDGRGEPAGCGLAGSSCGDVLNYLGAASGAIPTTGMLSPIAPDTANVVYFTSIESFDAIFAGCFEQSACL